jgi:ribokinase
MFKKSRAQASSYDLIAVGRASVDTFLMGEIFKPICSHGSCYEHIPLGAKLKVDDVFSSFGGNGLNAAVTFARQRLKVGLLTEVGVDLDSENLMRLIATEGISAELILKNIDAKLAKATTIVAPSGERSVLAYRGKSQDYIGLSRLFDPQYSRWVYISSLNSIEYLAMILRSAKNKGSLVAFNPGGVELLEHKKTLNLLREYPVEVLILNREEAITLLGSDGGSKQLAILGAKLASFCVVTDGPLGSHCGTADGRYFFQPISEDVAVVDRTGAGDAFASGLVSGLALGKDISEALDLGAKNSTSVVQKIGAQAGIIFTH